MNDDIVPELAHGKWAALCAMAVNSAALTSAPAIWPTSPKRRWPDIVIEDSDAFRRVIKRVPHGVVLGRGTVELPLYDRDQHCRPALIAGNA